METIRLLESSRKMADLSAEERKLLGGFRSCRRRGCLLLCPPRLAEIIKNKNKKDSPRIHAVLCGEGLLILRVRIYNTGEKFRKNREKLEEKRDDVCRQVRDCLGGFPVRMLTAVPTLLAEEAAEAGLPPEELRRRGFLFKAELEGAGTGDWEERLLREVLEGAPEETDEARLREVLRWLDPDLDPDRCLPEEQAAVPGAPEEELALTETDRAVRLLFDGWERETAERRRARLMEINRYMKGDSRIIGCAGSGKSAVLAAKAVRAAEANPGKRFLITCFNSRLQESYSRKMGAAAAHLKFTEGPNQGKDRVECCTFDALCRSLLQEIEAPEPSVRECLAGYRTFEAIRQEVRRQLDQGTIARKYYGILIDEVQQFDLEWLEICYDLLENRDTGDHLFLLSGDITQKMKDLGVELSVAWKEPGEGRGADGPMPEARIRAPWEEEKRKSYPDFRFQNQVLRMGTNYRCCVPINRFLRSFSQAARQRMLENGMIPHEEEFLSGADRGWKEEPGSARGVKLCLLRTDEERSNEGEARAVAGLVRELMEGENRIPPEEIAILYYNKSHRQRDDFQDRWRRSVAWQDGVYDLEAPLTEELRELLGDDGFFWNGQDEDDWMEDGRGRLTVLSFDRAPGLSRRAVILCGLLPLGDVDGRRKGDPNAQKLLTLSESTRIVRGTGQYGTKDGQWMRRSALLPLKLAPKLTELEKNYIEGTELFMQAAWEDLHTLYMACSRARDALCIVAPDNLTEDPDDRRWSVYVELLKGALQGA